MSKQHATNPRAIREIRHREARLSRESWPERRRERRRMHQPILLIGEAPGLLGDEGPLEGQIGRRLAEYAGLTLVEYLERTERHNLFDTPIEKWPREEAALHAGVIWSSLIGRRTILLGHHVADAFGIRWRELTWAQLDDRGTEVALVPHPSGRNIWWNEAGNRAEARRFLREAFGTSDR